MSHMLNETGFPASLLRLASTRVPRPATAMPSTMASFSTLRRAPHALTLRRVTLPPSTRLSRIAPGIFMRALPGRFRAVGRPRCRSRLHHLGCLPQILQIPRFRRVLRLQSSPFAKDVVLARRPVVRLTMADTAGAVEHRQLGIAQELIEQSIPVGQADVLPPHRTELGLIEEHHGDSV